MQNLFVTMLLGILLAVGLSSAAIAEEDENGNPTRRGETYETGPFGQREDGDQSSDQGNSTEEEQSGENGQTDQSNQSQEESPENSQSNGSDQSGETGQSGENN